MPLRFAGQVWIISVEHYLCRTITSRCQYFFSRSGSDLEKKLGDVSTSRSSIFCSFNISWKCCYTALFSINNKIVDKQEELLLARIMPLMDVRLKNYIIMFRSHLGLLTFRQLYLFALNNSNEFLRIVLFYYP